MGGQNRKQISQNDSVGNSRMRQGDRLTGEILRQGPHHPHGIEERAGEAAMATELSGNKATTTTYTETSLASMSVTTEVVVSALAPAAVQAAKANAPAVELTGPMALQHRGDGKATVASDSVLEYDQVRHIVENAGQSACNLVAWDVPHEGDLPKEGVKSTLARPDGTGIERGNLRPSGLRSSPLSPRRRQSAGGETKGVSTERLTIRRQVEMQLVGSKHESKPIAQNLQEIQETGMQRGQSGERGERSEKESGLVDGRSVARGRGGIKKDVRARYWVFLFENLECVVDEIFQTCEKVVECKEVIMMLDSYTKDFKSLIDRIHMLKDFEKNTEEGNRPTSLAWELRRSSPGQFLSSRVKSVLPPGKSLTSPGNSLSSSLNCGTSSERMGSACKEAVVDERKGRGKVGVGGRGGVEGSTVAHSLTFNQPSHTAKQQEQQQQRPRRQQLQQSNVIRSLGNSWADKVKDIRLSDPIPPVTVDNVEGDRGSDKKNRSGGKEDTEMREVIREDKVRGGRGETDVNTRLVHDKGWAVILHETNTNASLTDKADEIKVGLTSEGGREFCRDDKEAYREEIKIYKVLRNAIEEKNALVHLLAVEQQQALETATEAEESYLLEIERQISEERDKALKKRCKKIHFHMNQRLVKAIKELNKCLQGGQTTTGPWSQNKISSLDRSLGKLRCILDKQVLTHMSPAKPSTRSNLSQVNSNNSNNNRESANKSISNQGATTTDTNHSWQPRSMNELLPLEVIEMILMETIVAETLGNMSMPDHQHVANLTSVCQLWHQIIHGQRFKNIMLPKRFNNIAPKSLCKRQLFPVKCVGLSNLSSFNEVALLQNKVFTIERPLQQAISSIFVYDAQLNFRVHIDSWIPELKLELTCINRRLLSTVTGLTGPSKILTSTQGNCIFVVTVATFHCKIFKMDSNGTLLGNWDVPNSVSHELESCVAAVDPSGQYLVCVMCPRFSASACVFSSSGSLLGSIKIQCYHFGIKFVAILSDATVVVTCFDRLIFIRAQWTKDGMLNYESLLSALKLSQSIVILQNPCHFSGSCIYKDMRGCFVIIRSKDIIFVDSESAALHAAQNWTRTGSYMIRYHSDTLLGLLFF